MTTKDKKGDKGVLISYTEVTRIGLLEDGAFYDKVNITIGGETWKRFTAVWDEFYKGKTADDVMADLLAKAINTEYGDVRLGIEHGDE